MEVNHHSDHDSIFFKIHNSKKLSVRKKILIPRDKEMIEDFQNKFILYQNTQDETVDPLTKFYKSIMSAAKECKMIKEFHSKPRIGKLLNKEQTKMYKFLIGQARNKENTEEQKK